MTDKTQEPAEARTGVEAAAPDTTAKPEDISTYDQALVAAWQRFLDYDYASLIQKQIHQRIRMAIIILAIFTSVGAIISVYAINWAVLDGLISGVLRLALVLMPIASVALTNYAAQFATSTGWIEYRVSAELIRTQIYLYRLKVKPYQGKDQENQLELLRQVGAVDNWMSRQNMPMPQMRVLKDADVIAQIQAKAEGKGDTGFVPLEVEQYVEWRVRDQLAWYTGRIDKDYRTMRNNRVIALIVAAVGSGLAAIGGGIEGLVGVTTALGVGLTLISDVRLYGRTYRIYYEAAYDLKNLLNQWNLLSKEQRREKKDAFVLDFETVFDHERTRWREETIRTQISSEQAIYSQVQQVAGSQAQNTLVANKFIPSDVPPRPTAFSSTNLQDNVNGALPVTGSDARPPNTNSNDPDKNIDGLNPAGDAPAKVVEDQANQDSPPAPKKK